MEGNPRYASTQSLPNVPYAKFAELIGLKGIYVDRPERTGNGLGRGPRRR